MLCPAVFGRSAPTAELESLRSTVQNPGILAKIRPRNCPNQSYVRCVTTAATRQASVAESPVALQPIAMESRHAVSHALNPRHRMLPAGTGQHAGPNMPLLRRHHAAPPDDPRTWGAFGTVHLCLPFLRTGRREGSQAGWHQGNLNWHLSIK